MREAYFTQENIDEKSEMMLREIEQYRERHDINFTVENAALLVMDMQKYFLDEKSHAYVPSAPAIIPRIRSLIEAFLSDGRPVFFTRHIDVEEGQNPMARWWKDSIKEEDPLSEIIQELDFPDATIIKKNQYDAFYGTELEDLLKKRGIEQIVITGVMAHLCCETTARSAFVRGFEVFFPVDGTASYNQEFHQATLLNLSHGFAVPVLCKELENALRGCEHR